MKFVVEINLGNEAMNSPHDVADALEKVIRNLRMVDEFGDGFSGRLRDVNGNTVGTFNLEGEFE